MCIIGAGPAGLSMARALRRFDLEYDQYERHSGVGGVWDIDNPGSPMYESAHFITSRSKAGFFDFPMPAALPDFPGHAQVLNYTRDFAASYGLESRIRFGTGVSAAVRAGDRWLVTLDDGTEREYDALICATGVTWTPRMPTPPGHFAGEIRHSSTYRHAREFDGKRVVIVGLGNSAADIAADAVATAASVRISLRRGYHLVPKTLLGRPSEEFADRGAALPLPVARWLSTTLVRLLYGDATRYGMPAPDHRLLESHPLVNSQLLHHLQHGDIALEPEITALDGDRVEFADGSTESADLILYATGYDWSIPYLPTDYFDWRDGRPDLYLNAFSRTRRNLFGVGYLEVNSSAYALFDSIANLIAHYLHDQRHNPSRAAEFDVMIAHDRPDLTGSLRLLDTARHRAYVDGRTYRRYLTRVARATGWQDLTPGMFGPG
ncbi:flavin-containing monooxygenase [Nocardia sp. NPDC055321]